ncbi:MAG: hypothetical protein AAF985_04645 [Bacteroidota bacterium]
MKIPVLNSKSNKLVAFEVLCLLLLSVSIYLLSVYFTIEQADAPKPLAANLAVSTPEPVPTPVIQQTVTIRSTKIDPWQALIHQLDIATKTLQTVAPHFPQRYSPHFTTERKAWTKRYPEEVKAMLNIPEVKTLNPSHITLGVEGLIPREEIYNPFWYMYHHYPTHQAKIDRVAPHFPRPDRALEIEAQERQYKIDFRNWAENYPREFDGFREITMN